MKQYVAPILPWAMASGGISLAILCIIAWIVPGSDRHELAIFLFGGSLFLLLLAWLCRVSALRGQVKATASIIVAYGTIFCTFTCLSANHRGTDLLGAFPFCMILFVIGSFFAMSIWQLLAGYLGTMIPPTILAAHIGMELTGGLFRSLLLLTLTTGVTFFILASRFRHNYFKLLHRERERSRRDSLTGLLNRNAWNDSVLPAISAARGANRPSSVLYLDVDYFKTLNDRYGHDFGDRILNRVAGSLRDACGDDAIIARFGGDEFVVLFPGIGLAAACDSAIRIQQALRDLSTGEEEASVTVSIGIAECGSNEPLLDTIRRADLALLQAKSRGKDRMQVAQPISTGQLDSDMPETSKGRSSSRGRANVNSHSL